jgi:hypothetical protein
MTNENDDQIFNIFCIPFFFSIELEINSVDINSTKWVCTNKHTINSATKLERKYRNFRVFCANPFWFIYIYIYIYKTPEEPTKLAKEGKIKTLMFLHKPILEKIPKKKSATKLKRKHINFSIGVTITTKGVLTCQVISLNFE